MKHIDFDFNRAKIVVRELNLRSEADYMAISYLMRRMASKTQVALEPPFDAAYWNSLPDITW